MKLRNKKTGGLANLVGDDFFRVRTDAGWADYNSLAELNEEWEDYKPTGPCLKDEEIRNLVKNFALYTNATWIQYESTGPRGEFWTEGGFIASKDWKELEGLVNHQCYTPAELFGEEE